ncbi:hypothetical protein QTH09_16645 [Clostridium perfringens]|nr:hypothetical protein [Clostridium perfringens]
MSIKYFKKFLDELREQGIEIENLKIYQVSESIKLFKLIQHDREQLGMRVVTIISEKVGSLIENKEISQEEIKKIDI